MKRLLLSFLLVAFAIWIWGSCTTASMQNPSPSESKVETQQAPFELSLQVGDMKFEYIRYSGIRLTVHDSPMITGSALYVVQPGWVPPRYYGLVDHPFLIHICQRQVMAFLKRIKDEVFLNQGVILILSVQG